MIDKLKQDYRRRTLAGKMGYAMIQGAVLFFLVFLSAYTLCSLLVENVYMSSRNISRRENEIYRSFASYVTSNALSITDEDAIAHWSDEQDYVSIYIFEGERLSLRASDGRAEQPDNNRSGSSSQFSTLYGTLYPVRFRDGVHRIAISDSSQNRMLSWSVIVSLCLAFSVFIAVVFSYVRRLTRRVEQLAAEVEAIGSGTLDAPITTEGSDELAVVAHQVDSMRNAITLRMENERQAWQANSDLVTAISHDLRTPLTSLLGYLGLMNDEECAPGDLRRYARAANTKALRLRELTDELFRYFLVFGKSDLRLDLQVYNAGLLFGQLLGEAGMDLTENGFVVDSRMEVGDAEVLVDSLYLKRIMDNLISNIKKYADRNRPVLFHAAYDGDRVTVRLENFVMSGKPRAESNKIGLRTCSKVTELMGGTFSTRLTDRFTAVLQLKTRK